MKQTIKDKEARTLVLGCGNSALSEQMHKSLGLKKDIVSIDFEEAVIKRMKNKGVAGVEYLVMDATAMSFDSGSFDYAIDKGTLDALCSDKSPETASRVIAYFNEIVRVLSPKGGVYIGVSLLQDFVLDSLVSFFQMGMGNTHSETNTFDFRI